MSKLMDLEDRLFDLNERAQAILATAEAEKRDLTDEERKEFDGLIDDAKEAEADIDRIKAFEARTVNLQAISDRLNEGNGRVTEPKNPSRGTATVPAEPVNTRDRGSWGFKGFGEFARSVVKASARGGNVDPRLVQNAPTTFGSEGVGEDGGFAVPPDFRTAIVQMVQGETSLLSRTDQQVTSGNSFSQPIDETTPWQTSGGIQAYWEGEASQFTQSKPNFQQTSLRLHKLTALVGVTEELREDAPALDGYLRSKAPEKIGFKVNDAIINGSGAGMPLGIMNSPALITVAKEGSQANDTVHARNIAKMWARRYAPWSNQYVWLVNQDVESELPRLGEVITDPAGTAVGGSTPTYIAPGGLRNAGDFGLLFNRPVIVTEACAALGDLGDIILAAMPQYLTVTKVGGIRSEMSMHLWFDYDMAAFRFILRLAGHPWLSAPITRKNGSNTLSSFVTLAAR